MMSCPRERLAPDEECPAGATRRMLERHGPTLLSLAAASIRHGLDHRRALPVDIDRFDPELRADGACFVTLKCAGDLRGCVGSPQARRPLVEDVACNAFAAAFRDDRFTEVAAWELTDIAVSLSVLSPREPIPSVSEADLLSRLRPGIDGLIIQAGDRRALFLPQVWASLPRAESFLAHLKAKAGLSQTHWSADMQAWRFTAESVSSQALAEPASLWTSRV